MVKGSALCNSVINDLEQDCPTSQWLGAKHSAGHTWGSRGFPGLHTVRMLTFPCCTVHPCSPFPLLHSVPTWASVLCSYCCTMPPCGLSFTLSSPRCCTVPHPGVGTGSENQRREREPRGFSCCCSQGNRGSTSWAGAPQATSWTTLI